MNLLFNKSLANKYTSNSQIARILTENWVANNIYCPSCGNIRLSGFKNNAPVADFYCNECSSEFELKSKKDSFSKKIVDGAYNTMIERINSENNPNFFFLNYSHQHLEVKNFIVIPKHFFVNDIIEKRKPLGPNAKRAGWIGCNILLKNIPESGKIHFIKNGKVVPQKQVLEIWNKTSFLSKQKSVNRGWTLEIMKIIDQIPQSNFSLNNVYAYEHVLRANFPNNNFIKDKIRQQLQILRDKGLIEFKGKGNYSKLI